MGITKTFGFAFKTNEMAALLKALGNPARLKIIQYLMDHPKSSGSELLIILPLAQSTVSKHLSELKRVKLIKGKNLGNTIVYSINEKTWEKIQYFMQNEINIPTLEEV